MFDLKTTCKDCPFVVGSSTNRTLSPARISQIKSDLLYGKTFSCHKTVNYNEDEAPKIKEQHCVGAMMWLYDRGMPNQMMRIGERTGALNYDELSTHEEIID